MKNFLKEPLLHFFVLGALLFVVYQAVGTSAPPPETIQVTQQVVDNLRAQHRRTWQRAPTVEEMESLVQGWIREEVLVREGMALGLADNDPVVRRRVSQKMTFLAETALPQEPTDEQLQVWLDQHPQDYLIQPRYTFRQIFLDPQHYQQPLPEVANALLARLRAGEGDIVGDSLLLPPHYEDASAYQIQRRFGSEFETRLGSLPVGQWSGPLPSGFGMHLVLLTARTDSRTAQLAEVRQAVARDWQSAQARQAQQQLYETLRGRYSIEYTAEATPYTSREPEAE